MNVLIYLCLSSHGYGHAARQATIISELYRLKPHWRFVVSSDVEQDFLEVVFKDIPIEFRRFRWDVGTKQSTAVTVDIKETLIAIEALGSYLPDQITSEANWILNQSEKTVILADIPPYASELARKSDSYLIWISNFGWDEIYAPLGAEFNDISKQINDLYSKGDLLIRCPFSLKMDWGIPEKSIGLTVPKLRNIPEYLSTKFQSISRPMIIVAFGGLGMKFPIDVFSKWPDYYFIIPKSTQNNTPFLDNKFDNLFYLPESVRVFDVLTYCSRSIGKPGYSSFCECISNDIGLHVVNRSHFEESKALIAGLDSYASYRLIDQEDFYKGNWELNKELITSKNRSFLDSSGASSAADIVIDFCTNKFN